MSAASEATRFSSTRQPAHRGKVGRPRESRDRITSDFLAAISADFAVHGKSAIKEVRETDPSTYVRVVAALVPKEIEMRRPLAGIDDDKLAEILAILQATQIDAVAVTIEKTEAIQ